MNILFYVDPLIEMGRPYFKESWVNNFCPNIINSLRLSGGAGELNFTVIMNEPLSGKFKNPGNVGVVVFSQEELFKPFEDFNYLDVTKAWYNGTYSEEQIDYYVDLIKSRLNKAPDLVITFSPVPFIKKAFPGALVMHHEYGIFSRPPYPETWYFDIVGMNGGAYLSKYWNIIDENFSLSDEHANLLDNFIKKCRALITAKSPYKDIFESYKKEFDYLVLLPLQFSQYYLFDALTHYKSQFDYLIDILSKIPQNVGVVVTTHPDYNILNEEVVSYCRGKYKNFIYNDEFESYYAASQYIINEVDAVITVSSNIGLQTLLWDKKLISLGRDFLSFMADSCTLEEIEPVLKRDRVNKNKILFWILTHYAVPKHYISNPQWIEGFFTTSLEKSRQDVDKANFYNVIDDNLDRLFNNLSEGLTDINNIPQPTHFRKYPMKEIMQLCEEKLNELNPNKEVQLFFDYGEGFAEERSIKKRISKSDSLIEFELSGVEGLVGIRFDPADISVALKLLQAEIETDAGKTKIAVETTNANYCDGNVFYFLTNDPHIMFKFEQLPKKVKRISFSVEYLAFGSEIRDAFLHLLETKERTIADKNYEIAGKDSIIDEQNLKLEMVKKFLQPINEVRKFFIKQK